MWLEFFLSFISCSFHLRTSAASSERWKLAFRKGPCQESTQRNRFVSIDRTFRAFQSTILCRRCFSSLTEFCCHWQWCLSKRFYTSLTSIKSCAWKSKIDVRAKGRRFKDALEMSFVLRRKSSTNRKYFHVEAFSNEHKQQSEKGTINDFNVRTRSFECLITVKVHLRKLSTLQVKISFTSTPEIDKPVAIQQQKIVLSLFIIRSWESKKREKLHRCRIIMDRN